ncbi:double-strand break repair protein AddB [Oceaniovalibus guishaninsula]|nr:double-strand break repair protein AddB [Oceaniovalibus guishaninsula]
MLNPGDPHVYGLPPGADFPADLIAGLADRLTDAPDDWARVEIFVNTRRMQRRIRELFAAGPPRLLPRLRLVTDIASDPAADIAPPVSPLRRRLELAQLVSALVEADPGLAPRAAVQDLADSLAAILDEMQGEGVPLEALADLDVSDLSGHWDRSLRFIRLVGRYLDPDAPPDPEARQRRAIERLAMRWRADPPRHPVIVAGSTGSRGATSLLMQAVADLPQGALILPGYDFCLPPSIWATLDDTTAEDHPQYRYAALMRRLGIAPEGIGRWTPTDPRPRRNRLISLALRPAPVTDQWRSEGAGLPDLTDCTAGLSLMEAPDARTEALAIALALRHAAEEGRTAALVTPDRDLTRRVTAALDRWEIEPDDSAGRPLAQSAPGRLLRHVAHAAGRDLTSEDLLVLLKHPLTHTGAERGEHLRHTRDLELWLRRRGPAFLRPATLADWQPDPDPQLAGWIAWLAGAMDTLADPRPRSLPDWVERHIALTETLAAGCGAAGSGELWLEAAGIRAAETMTDLRAAADAGGDHTPAAYAALIDTLLQGVEVRDPVRPRPDIAIWGTLEARVQGADLVILAGLNEGVWPEAPAPDPWLNRAMRRAAGLLLPERRIGLSAHDFQQAAAAPRVIFSRARRDAEAETVMSRWLNRLTNLISGLPARNGPEALAAMRSRGEQWLSMARRIESVPHRLPPAPRPAPRPPVASRPTRLSITDIERLRRDPYAVYARHVLRLRPLDPLRQDPGAALRGTVVHEIFERFVKDGVAPDDPAAASLLIGIADDVLQAQVAWPAARRVWRARLERTVPFFLATELNRRRNAAPHAIERSGEWPVPGTGVTLTGKADRIDLRDDATLAIYDYKTSAPPSDKEVQHFARQLLLEGLMAEAGAFDGLPAGRVSELAYIGVGTSPKVVRISWRDGVYWPERVLTELCELLNAYRDGAQGYMARRAPKNVAYAGDYDDLSRFGEWSDSDAPFAQDVP